MSFLKTFQILALSGLLTGYSEWARERLTEEAEAKEAVDLGGVSRPTDCKIRLVRLPEAKDLWRKDSTVFLDVRSSQDYQVGHIRGALSLPWEDFEEGLPQVKRDLQMARTIVVYCKSVDCGKSLFAAVRLHAEGLHQVLIYPDGWYQWANRHLPATRSSR